MRIPAWTPELKPQPQDMVDAILARRGGSLLNLDKALSRFSSEPPRRASMASTMSWGCGLSSGVQAGMRIQNLFDIKVEL